MFGEFRVAPGNRVTPGSSGRNPEFQVIPAETPGVVGDSGRNPGFRQTPAGKPEFRVTGKPKFRLIPGETGFPEFRVTPKIRSSG